MAKKDPLAKRVLCELSTPPAENTQVEKTRRIAFTQPLATSLKFVLGSLKLLFIKASVFACKAGGQEGELLGEAEIDFYKASLRDSEEVKHGLALRGLPAGLVSLRFSVRRPRLVSQLACCRLSDGELLCQSSVICAPAAPPDGQLARLFAHVRPLFEQFVERDRRVLWDNTSNAYISFKYKVLSAYAKLHAVVAAPAAGGAGPAALVEGSRVFLVLMESLLEEKHRIDPCEKGPYYTLLQAVCAREELRVEALGWQQRGGFPAEAKKAVGLLAQRVFYRLLRQAIKDFSTNMSQEHLEFNCKVIALSYFKFPLFRAEFLAALCGAPAAPGRADAAAHDRLFAWESQFTRQVAAFAEHAQIEGILHSAVRRLRSTKFNSFATLTILGHLLAHVEASAEGPGGDFAGYEELRAHFVAQFLLKGRMQSIELIGRVAKLFMLHEENFNLFCSAMAATLSMRRQSDIQKFFYILQAGCTYFREAGAPLPGSFDLHCLGALLAAFIREDQAFGTFECLNFVYVNFALFAPAVKKELVALLAGFPALLLHWDGNVQHLYAHFICFRVVELQEAGRVDVADALRRLLFFVRAAKAVGDAYAERLIEWEPRRRRFKKRHPLRALQAAVLAAVPALVAALDATTCRYVQRLGAQSLRLGASDCAAPFGPLAPAQLAYCPSAAAAFDEIFDRYLRSTHRKTKKEEHLPRLLHALSLDRKESLQK